MKATYILAAAAALAFAACEKNDTVKDKINDGLDRRPAEGIQDAGEDIKDAAKDVKEDVKDATR
ncbi:hypothetical protein OJ996_26005 [Luteolibacter sp. GHJ8]|uniref:Uncharacterized protein n=1 Tax=Luteolibacter rhizosphaerae TaxID=2989719 RepID=A0ABT3GBA7_9BACT|nr:hypothetical protein [Luteolibacter rhizosphaerae]MCW1917070.1 hypothetical protein [Luteolibacter rhizosphaerae]